MSKITSSKTELTYTSFRDANNRMIGLTLIETLAIVGISFWQVWYIKRLLNNRRLV
jgi:hypothetical protein